MKINFKRQYRKKVTGVLVFVFAVSGTPEELKAFKKSKGDKFVQDTETKEMLYFTTRLVKDNCPLIKTAEGQYVPDTSREDQLLNLIGQGYSHEVALTMLPGSKVATAPVAETEED